MTSFSLHQLIRATLAWSQISGFFPVRGVLENDSSKLRFRWCSFLMVYWLISWIGLSFFSYRTYIITNFRNPNGSLSAISNSSNPIYNGSDYFSANDLNVSPTPDLYSIFDYWVINNPDKSDAAIIISLLRVAGPPLVIYPLFLQLSHRWPRFIHKWEEIEAKLELLSSPKVLSYKITICTITFSALRFLFYLSSYMIAGVRIIQCEGATNLQGFVRMLFQVRFPQIFSITTPTSWKFFACLFLELMSTGSLLFSELIVLHMSLLLLERFRVFNNHLNNTSLKISPHFWHMMRKEYVKLTRLTKMADSLLSPFIFSIVILETVLIILFIYLVLTNSYTLLSYGYFFIFFLSHLSIDILTLIAMASIFDESRKPLTIIHNLPSALYCFEVRRLYIHVKRDTVALTGCKFFVVTQTTILSIISALVTYEVLLVQLGNLKHEPGSSDSSADSNFCNWIEDYLRIKQ